MTSPPPTPCLSVITPWWPCEVGVTVSAVWVTEVRGRQARPLPRVTWAERGAHAKARLATARSLQEAGAWGAGGDASEARPRLWPRRPTRTVPSPAAALSTGHDEDAASKPQPPAATSRTNSASAPAAELGACSRGRVSGVQQAPSDPGQSRLARASTPSSPGAGCGRGVQRGWGRTHAGSARPPRCDTSCGQSPRWRQNVCRAESVRAFPEDANRDTG